MRFDRRGPVGCAIEPPQRMIQKYWSRQSISIECFFLLYCCARIDFARIEAATKELFESQAICWGLGGEVVNLRKSAIAVACLSLGISACGTYVPGLQEFYDPQNPQTMVDAIVSNVQCEVQTAVQFLILDDQDAAVAAAALGKVQKPSLTWLKKWAAQVTLTLTVDEKAL
jgi:hypothetical protein